MGLASSKSLNVLCDETTFKLCRSTEIKFQTDLQKEFVKGKSEKIAIFRPFLKINQEKLSIPQHLNIFSPAEKEKSKLDMVGREEITKKIDKIVKKFFQVNSFFLLLFFIIFCFCVFF